MKRRLISNLIAGVALAALSRAGAAFVLVDNLDTYYQGISIMNEFPICQTFNSGTASRLTSVSVCLYSSTATPIPGNYYIDVYEVDPSTHVPTTLLYGLGSGLLADLPAETTHKVTYSGLSIPVSPATDYGIFVSTDSDTVIRVGRQNHSDSGSLPPGFLATTWQIPYANNSAVVAAITMNSYPARMQILGETTAVPEPSQWAGMGVAAAIGVCLMRQKRLHLVAGR